MILLFLLFFRIDVEKVKLIIENSNISYFDSKKDAEIFVWCNWENAEPQKPWMISLRCNGVYDEYDNLYLLHLQELPKLFYIRYNGMTPPAKRLKQLSEIKLFCVVDTKLDLFLWVNLLRLHGYNISWSDDAVKLYLRK